MTDIKKRLKDGDYKKVSALGRKRAVEDLAALSVKLPPWEKIEKEIEGRHED